MSGPTVSLWSQKSFYRQTRKGKILQSTSELYLRDDLGLGFTIPSQLSSKRNNVSVNVTGSAKKISDTQELLSLLVPSYSNRERKLITRLVVVDTNVLLHNIDVLEHSSFALSNIVITQTALVECRHRSFSSYGRVMDLLRSSSSNANGSASGTNNTSANTSANTAKKRCAIFFPDVHHVSTQYQGSSKSSINDKNDAKIRQVALFYGEALAGTDVEIILLSDDKGCRDLAITEQEEIYRDGVEDDDDDVEKGVDYDDNDDIYCPYYKPQSVKEHVAILEQEDPHLSLSDLVAQLSTTSTKSGNISKGKKTLFHKPHLPQDELSLGTKSGKYYQGTIRAERGSCDKCYVTVRKGDDRVAVNIIGSNDINRAVDGDVVVIQLHSIDKWIGHDDIHTHRNKTNGSSSSTQQTVGIAEETAEPSIRDESNVTDAIDVPTEESKSENEVVVSSSPKRPTGKVVGIMRRNFRKNYCGSIHSIASKVLAQSDINKGKTGDVSNLLSPKDLTAKKYEVEHEDGTITCVFYAVDARVPPVLVRTTQRERLIGKRILIAIDSWPSDSEYPLGHYVKTVGESGVKDVETEVLLHEHNIPCAPFPAKVRKSHESR